LADNLEVATLPASGKVVSGFGRISTGSVFGNPRDRQIVVRFQF
jgi:hypothetical protein